MSRRRMRIFRLFPLAALAGLAAVCLAGCLVGPKYHPPATPPPPAYKEAPANFPDQAWQPAQPSDAMLRGPWWQVFNDPELNALEVRLNIDNQNIQSAFASFQASRELVREAASQLLPTVTASPGISRAQSSATLGSGAAGATGPAAATQGSASNDFTLPFDVSWEPDLWGKVRNTIREEQYAAQLSAADLENERLTEQADLAVYFFELRGQDALAAMYDATVAADQKSLALTQSLYQTGIDTQQAVFEAEGALQSAQAAATGAGVARAQYEHAIAVLAGQMPESFALPVKALVAAPPPIPLGLPSQLLERRPDIAAAERTMAEANAVIGIAQAAYYPTLTLSASGGLESSSIANWLTWPSRFFSIGASGAETIFDAGLRRATVNQYLDTYNADLAAYRETVLAAFQQVEDYLAALRIDAQELAQQQQAVNSAQSFLNIELARYQTGLDPYIDVLTAQNTLLTAQQDYATLHTQEMVAAVELVQALGGGWDRSQLPTPAQVSH